MVLQKTIAPQKECNVAMQDGVVGLDLHLRSEPKEFNHCVLHCMRDRSGYPAGADQRRPRGVIAKSPTPTDAAIAEAGGGMPKELLKKYANFAPQFPVK